jgi:hypothetical protein
MFLGSEIFKKEVMQNRNNTFSEHKSKEIINQRIQKPFLESRIKNNLSDKILKKKEESENGKNF